MKQSEEFQYDHSLLFGHEQPPERFYKRFGNANREMLEQLARDEAILEAARVNLSARKREQNCDESGKGNDWSPAAKERRWLIKGFKRDLGISFGCCPIEAL